MITKVMHQLRAQPDGDQPRMYFWDEGEDWEISIPAPSEIEALITARKHGTYLGDDKEFWDTLTTVYRATPPELVRRHARTAEPPPGCCRSEASTGHTPLQPPHER
jgi:hypothetical protein